MVALRYMARLGYACRINGLSEGVALVWDEARQTLHVRTEYNGRLRQRKCCRCSLRKGLLNERGRRRRQQAAAAASARAIAIAAAFVRSQPLKMRKCYSHVVYAVVMPPICVPYQEKAPAPNGSYVTRRRHTPCHAMVNGAQTTNGEQCRKRTQGWWCVYVM